MIEGAPDDRWCGPGGATVRADHERVFPLGVLRGDVVRLVPGEKIADVTDVGFHEENRRRIVSLAAGATRLFIECPFSTRTPNQAAARSHLTARQAGLLARESEAQIVVPFHFSPRYETREAELRAEIDAAHAGG